MPPKESLEKAKRKIDGVLSNLPSPTPVPNTHQAIKDLEEAHGEIQGAMIDLGGRPCGGGRPC